MMLCTSNCLICCAVNPDNRGSGLIATSRRASGARNPAPPLDWIGRTKYAFWGDRGRGTGGMTWSIRVALLAFFVALSIAGLFTFLAGDGGKEGFVAYQSGDYATAFRLWRLLA